jgi:hypothetical protein
VLCHTEALGPMGMVWELLIIHPLVGIHPMVGHFMVLSLGQAVVVSHGAEAVAGYLAAGGDSVVGGNEVETVAWGPGRNPVGIGHPIPISPRHKQKEEEV